MKNYLGATPWSATTLLSLPRFLDEIRAISMANSSAKAAVPPLLTVLGVALRATVGVVEATVTVADCDALPPRPAHVST